VNAVPQSVLLAESTATCWYWERLLHAERWDSVMVCAAARIASS